MYVFLNVLCPLLSPSISPGSFSSSKGEFKVTYLQWTSGLFLCISHFLLYRQNIKENLPSIYVMSHLKYLKLSDKHSMPHCKLKLYWPWWHYTHTTCLDISLFSCKELFNYYCWKFQLKLYIFDNNYQYCNNEYDIYVRNDSYKS